MRHDRCNSVIMDVVCRSLLVHNCVVCRGHWLLPDIDSWEHAVNSSLHNADTHCLSRSVALGAASNCVSSLSDVVDDGNKLPTSVCRRRSPSCSASWSTSALQYRNVTKCRCTPLSDRSTAVLVHSRPATTACTLSTSSTLTAAAASVTRRNRTLSCSGNVHQQRRSRRTRRRRRRRRPASEHVAAVTLP